MKRSNTILFIVIGFTVLFIIVAIVGSRIAIGSFFNTGKKIVEENVKNGENVHVYFDNTHFNELQIDGAWRVNTTAGEEYSIDVFCPESISDKISIEQRGDQLIFTDIFSLERLRAGIISVEVTMPMLEYVEINGAASIYINDFIQDNFNVEINGAGNVKGLNNAYKNLDVEINGTAKIDFGGSETENAEIDIEGAGSVTVAITGGVLDGSIDGLGNVKYYGDISSNRIDIDGLGKVKKLE